MRKKRPILLFSSTRVWLGHFCHWAFSPRVELAFFGCRVSSESASFVRKKELHAPRLFNSKNLHNRFSAPSLNSSLKVVLWISCHLVEKPVRNLESPSQLEKSKQKYLEISDWIMAAACAGLSPPNPCAGNPCIRKKKKTPTNHNTPLHSNEKKKWSYRTVTVQDQDPLRPKINFKIYPLLKLRSILLRKKSKIA